MSDNNNLENEEKNTGFASESTVAPEAEKEDKKKKNKDKNKIKPKKYGRKRHKWILWLIIPAALIALCLVVWFTPFLYSFAQKYISFLPDRTTQQQVTSDYTQIPVTRRTITNTLTGTGTLQPIDSYTITSKVTGEIISAGFEEMQQVEKDAPLFVIDSSDLQSEIDDFADNVEDAREALADLEEEYADLYLYSEYSGICREVYVEEGDNVQNGTKIAHIIDRDTMLLEVPFFVQDLENISIGQQAQVTVNSATESVMGTVTEIGKFETVTAVGTKTCIVTISVENPGAITTSTTAYAMIDGIESTEQGTFKYNVDEEITAEYSGEIETLNFEEGDAVTKGALVMTLSSETLDDRKEDLEKQLEKAQESYDDYVEKLEDYTITAPISGTVVQKNYKVSDNLSTGSGANSALAIIYDMSKLNFDMNIDETDFAAIKVGQEVTITSDSFDQTYTGYVKKKSIVGNSSMGTTTYPVTIELDGNDVLLPGMNVNATIYIEKVENVLAVPVEAIMRGDRVRILKRDSSSDSGTAHTPQANRPQMPEGEFPKIPENVANGELPDMPNMVGNGGFPNATEGAQRPHMSRDTQQQTTDVITEEDFEIVNVVTGVSDDEYVEIVSGLEDGDIVVIENITIDSNATVTGMIGGFGGGMSGGFSGGMSGGYRGTSGAMPSGAMGGGMPR